MPIVATTFSAAFNLSCVISSITSADTSNLPQRPVHPLTMEFRIDLKQGRFCEGECRSTEAIAKVTDYLIFLRAATDLNHSDYLELNRESGELVSTLEVAQTRTSRTGLCKVKPFSGFPDRRF